MAVSRRRVSCALGYRLASRLSAIDAKQLADTIEGTFTMGTSNRAVRKIRELGELRADEESDLFDLEELRSVALALESPAFVEGYPRAMSTYARRSGFSRLAAECSGSFLAKTSANRAYATQCGPSDVLAPGRCHRRG